MSSFWWHCTEAGILKTAVRTALVVGTVLAAINHFEAILSGSFAPVQIFKIGLTYMVPFCVATYAGARQAQRAERR